MSWKRKLITAAGLLALVGPMAASAQSWGGSDDQRDWRSGQSDHGYQLAQDDRGGDNRYGDRGDRGDRDREDHARGRFTGYPELAGLRDRVMEEIRDAQRDGVNIHRVQGLWHWYQANQSIERRDFEQYRWNLPDRERAELRQRYVDLEARIGQYRRQR